MAKKGSLVLSTILGSLNFTSWITGWITDHSLIVWTAFIRNILRKSASWLFNSSFVSDQSLKEALRCVFRQRMNDFTCLVLKVNGSLCASSRVQRCSTGVCVVGNALCSLPGSPPTETRLNGPRTADPDLQEQKLPERQNRRSSGPGFRFRPKSSTKTGLKL